MREKNIGSSSNNDDGNASDQDVGYACASLNNIALKISLGALVFHYIKSNGGVISRNKLDELLNIVKSLNNKATLKDVAQEKGILSKFECCNDDSHRFGF